MIINNTPLGVSATGDRNMSIKYKKTNAGYAVLQDGKEIGQIVRRKRYGYNWYFWHIVGDRETMYNTRQEAAEALVRGFQPVRLPSDYSGDQLVELAQEYANLLCQAEFGLTFLGEESHRLGHGQRMSEIASILRARDFEFDQYVQNVLEELEGMGKIEYVDGHFRRVQ